MYDQTSAGRDREMDVGTSYDATSRSATATTSTEFTESGSTGDEPTGGGMKDKATTAAKTGTQAANQGARDVAQTAKEQARNVADEVSTQARRVAGDVREQLRDRTQQQHGTMVNKLRQASDEMREMAQGREQSPATSLVGSLAERTNRFADHLESRGPDGVLTDVQEFARRRPGTFLLAAAAAGFVVGRLGKSIFTAPNSPLSGDSGTTDSGEGDYRQAYQAGAADTYAGFRSDESATTTGAAAGGVVTGTAAASGGTGTETTVPIRDDGGWEDPRPEDVASPIAGTGDEPGGKIPSPRTSEPLPASSEGSRS